MDITSFNENTQKKYFQLEKIVSRKKIIFLKSLEEKYLKVIWNI